MSRRGGLALVMALVCVGLGAGWLWSQRPRELPALETELPEFVEPDPSLPRAPTSTAFDIAVGAIDLDELDAHLTQLGIACDDTGVRAIVRRLRESKAAELAGAADPDAVTGASIVWKRSKKERNPQVRLSCPVGSLAELEPRRGPTPKGRALFVFDSPEHPLRHASMRRNHADRVSAIQDLQATLALHRARFGEPTATRGAIPEFEEELLDRLAPIGFSWRYSDLFVELTLTDYERHVSVDERVEVPWPVSADAPSRP